MTTKMILKNIIVDYTHYLSPTSLARRPSAIRKLMPLMKRPGMVSLGGGLPNSAMFPFCDTMEFRVTMPSNMPSASLEKSDSSSRPSTVLVLQGKVLEEALQYSPTPGLPSLISQLRLSQEREHHLENLVAGGNNSGNPLYDVSVTVGSQDGLTKAFEMLLQPPNRTNSSENNANVEHQEDDDEVLLENPTYSGALAFLQPFGVKLTAIQTDDKGLDPDNLHTILTSNKKDQRKRGRKVLYLIPTAQNPSGITLENDRRQDIYQLACEHDLIILEDDPYYFLHPQREELVSFLELDARQCQNESSSSSPSNNRGKGGRVLRFDSFSKIFSAGMRIGYVTAPLPLLERLNLHVQATNLHNCGISQAMVSQLLSAWGSESGWHGLDTHLKNVADFYGMRRDWIVEEAERHLGGEQPLASWNVPTAGMFLWIKLHNNISDTKALIEEKAANANVLFVPGQAFDPLDKVSSYVRASYSTASREDMNVAMERLAEIIRGEATQ